MKYFWELKLTQKKNISISPLSIQDENIISKKGVLNFQEKIEFGLDITEVIGVLGEGEHEVIVNFFAYPTTRSKNYHSFCVSTNPFQLSLFDRKSCSDEFRIMGLINSNDYMKKIDGYYEYEMMKKIQKISSPKELLSPSRKKLQVSQMFNSLGSISSGVEDELNSFIKEMKENEEKIRNSTVVNTGEIEKLARILGSEKNPKKLPKLTFSLRIQRVIELDYEIIEYNYPNSLSFTVIENGKQKLTKHMTMVEKDVHKFLKKLVLYNPFEKKKLQKYFNLRKDYIVEITLNLKKTTNMYLNELELNTECGWFKVMKIIKD